MPAVGLVDEVFKPEDIEALGFVVELIIARFGMEAAFGFSRVGLGSTCCSTMASTGSSIVHQQRD